MPNATRQARREAGAERTLEAVACTRLFGKTLASYEPAPLPTRLLDHLIGEEEQGWGQRDPERLGRLQVNHELRLLGPRC
jgi:hypothetical protein